MLAIIRRCGSTMLRSILKQNKDVVVEGEIYRDYINLRQDLRKEKYENEVFRQVNLLKKLTPDKKYLYTVTGEDIMHLHKFNLLSHIMPSKVIFLYRRNLLEHYCSTEISRLTNTYIDNIESKNLKNKIHLEYNSTSVDRHVHNIKKSAYYILYFLKKYNLPYIKQEYNSILKETSNIFKFIDIDNNNYLPSTIKNETRSLSSIFINYSDIKKQYLLQL